MLLSVLLLRGTWNAVGTQSLLLASLTPKAALALAFAAAAKMKSPGHGSLDFFLCWSRCKRADLKNIKRSGRSRKIEVF